MMMQIRQTLETQNENQQEGFTISHVARITGVNAKTIRYYETVGLLPHPARFANHYRRYNLTDVNRLILLRRIRQLGVPLAHAKSLLRDVSDARCIDVQQELLHLVNARLITLDREIAELHQMREEMECYQNILSLCHPDEREVFSNCVDMSCIAVEGEKHQKGAQVC